MNIWVQLLGVRIRKILEGKKTSKIRRDFGQLLTLIANIPGTNKAIDKLKTALSTMAPPTFGKKMANFGPLTNKFTRLMFTRPK